MRRNSCTLYEQGLRDVIRKFDKDKDGVIGFHDFEQLLRQIGLEKRIQDAQSVYASQLSMNSHSFNL